MSGWVQEFVGSETAAKRAFVSKTADCMSRQE